ncbi:MAG: carboxypeptidase-like regulatory domain-containing protein [Candidatus Acidiferrales bacterium]
MKNAPEYEKQKSRRLSQGESLRHTHMRPCKMQGLIVLVCLGAIVSLVATSAQVRTATIAGRVVIPQWKAPITGVVVRVLDLQGNSVKAVYADDKGRFAIGGVAPGKYCVVFRKNGFLEGKRIVRLKVGKTLRLKVRLKVDQRLVITD